MDPHNLGQKERVYVLIQKKSDSILAGMDLVYLKLVLTWLPGSSGKAALTTLIVFFFFFFISMLGNYAGKMDESYAGAIMVFMTQDGCSHFKLNPHTSFTKNALYHSLFCEAKQVSFSKIYINNFREN